MTNKEFKELKVGDLVTPKRGYKSLLSRELCLVENKEYVVVSTDPVGEWVRVIQEDGNLNGFCPSLFELAWKEEYDIPSSLEEGPDTNMSFTYYEF